MAFKVGIIGGTGLEKLQIFLNSKDLIVDTPYGTSSDISEGTINGVACVVLSRHGKKHNVSPSDINYRANIWALKKLGVSVIISSSASGSLKEEYKPGHLVFLDSFIDRTTRRNQTFYDGENGHIKGICHIPAHPVFNDQIRSILIDCAKKLNFPYHANGTSVCIEGPRYSTRAESEMYRSWGASLVNMTVCPEAILAKELAIPYATIALITDYDCWKDTHEIVSVNLVDRILRENYDKAKALFVEAIKALNESKEILKAEILEAKEVAKSAVMDGGQTLNFDYI